MFDQRKPKGLLGRGENSVYIPDPMGRIDRGSWAKKSDPFGRLPEPPKARKAEKGFDLRNPFSLNQPVGLSGINKRDDVAKVETLLGRTGHFDPSKTKGPTGFFGTRLDQAVKHFQKDRSLKTDGLMNPGGETLTALAAHLGDAAEKTKSAPVSKARSLLAERDESRNFKAAPTASETPQKSNDEAKRSPDASRKDSGGGSNMQSPVPNPKMRNDNQGHGHFGADRDGGKRRHKGVDIESAPKTVVKSPVDGVVERIGDPYGDGNYKIVWIRTKDNREVGLYYVTPNDADGNPIIKPGDPVKSGAPVGTMQDLTKKFPGMDNHLHLEILRGGKAVDPAPWLKQWGLK
jgi:murein DD-endopeptidase MepM/ murein hydrolase activator NlpD